MKTNIVIFPFDLFGGGGTAAGAMLLGDALREMLDDNSRETIATRARAYQEQVRIKEFKFDKPEAYTDWRTKARQVIHQTWRKSEFLVWVAGNHLAALPVYDELAQHPADTLVIQFDAHLDIYNLSDSTVELSHGNFLLHSEGTLPPIINLGHRELLLRPEHIHKYYQRTFSAAELAIDPKPALNHVRHACAGAKRVFVDIDCDVLDSAFFPAQAHALPFGLSPHLLLHLLEAVWSDNIIGVAVSEFEPGRDVGDKSLSLLVWLLEYVLLKRYD